jgi:hypothetical protein
VNFHSHKCACDFSAHPSHTAASVAAPIPDIMHDPPPFLPCAAPPPLQIPVTFADLGTNPMNATVPTITPALSGCNASDANFTDLTADYTASVIYTCFYANRSQIPAVPITFTTYSNTSGKRE